MDVSSFWYTKNKDSKGITKLEILCIKSYLDNGYTFNLYTYDKDNEIFEKLNLMFENFNLLDANSIVPFSDYFSDDLGAGVAGFSDYFRYALLLNKPTVWVDLDMICLQHFDFSEYKYLFIEEKIKNQSNIVTTSLLKFAPGSEFGKKLFEDAVDSVLPYKDSKIPWGIIGPIFLNEHVKKFEGGGLRYMLKTIFLPARFLIMRYLNLLILSLKLTCKINHFCIFIMKCGEEMVWIKI